MEIRLFRNENVYNWFKGLFVFCFNEIYYTYINISKFNTNLDILY
jgi:hypothetical protein